MECGKTRDFCKELEKIGCEVVPYVGSTRQKNGVSDRWITHNSWPHGVWVEFKDHSTRISDLQEEWQRATNIRSAGLQCLIFRFHRGKMSGDIEYMWDGERMYIQCLNGRIFLEEVRRCTIFGLQNWKMYDVLRTCE